MAKKRIADRQLLSQVLNQRGIFFILNLPYHIEINELNQSRFYPLHGLFIYSLRLSHSEKMALDFQKKKKGKDIMTLPSTS